MSKSESPENVTTTREVEAALEDLIRAADRNNVDIPCTFDVTTNPGVSWMVEITKVDRNR